MVAAVLVAVGALAGIVGLVIHIRGDDNGVGHLRFASTTPARPPFDQFDESHVAVGSRCLHVLVASTESEREQGLRGVTAFAPYEGMLFVFPGDTSAQFTMAQTPTPLNITFFSSAGQPVDSQQMTPCPKGTDATCPAYAAKKRYRYALERPTGSAGASASGALGACAA